MKKLLLLLIIVLPAVKVFADTSASIPVSFTIPVMPGLNAPLIEEETVKTQTDATEQQKIETQRETQQQTPALIPQDIQEIKVVENQETTMIVKTIYSR